MFEWEDDNFSFEDSDRFEEDSICSWISEPESVVNNWRGWRKNNLSFPANAIGPNSLLVKDGSAVLSLTELAAREVAASIPFELVEQYPQPVPEQLQLRIAFWSFPEQEEDIRLYSCLANGSADEFNKGEHMLKIRAVKEPLQIGFHLSATIAPGNGKLCQSTSVTFDRKKIVSCQCSCNSQAEWCAHIVALCLHRIHHSSTVLLRAPVSESLMRLDRRQLQVFAQYLIAELPQQILPTAQRLLDELLSNEPTAINSANGAPDPTLGGAANEQTSWYLDGKNLKDNIKKILIKFCVPAPIVFSDVNYLSTTAPPSASEWCSYLRPLRGREPEGMWNLLSIVREMFRRNDRNSIPLLEIITQQCLETVQIMVWWFNTKVDLNSKRGPPAKQVNSNSQASQNACSSLCDEIVLLWKLAALNPCISPRERKMLKQRLIDYHITVIEKIQANQNSTSAPAPNANGANSKNTRKPSDFPGFNPAIEACMLDWEDYPIPGVTFGHNSHYLTPFAVFKLNDLDQSQVTSSPAVLRCEYPLGCMPPSQHKAVDNDPATGDENKEFESLETGNNSDEGVGEELEAAGTSKDKDAEDSAAERQDNEDEAKEDYEVYYYDVKEASKEASGGNGSSSNKSLSDRMEVFKNLRMIGDLDPFEVLFMRAEGIYAHGYHSHACKMAVSLAQDLLKSPPDLILPSVLNASLAVTSSTTAEVSTGAKGKKKKSADIAATTKASTILSQCAFLCTVLSEVPEYHNLAFQVGMFGIEMTRGPAATKPMEVKLAHQESELVTLLKKIPLGPKELQILRERAVILRDGTIRLRGESLLPLMLASYIFESLVMNTNSLITKSDEQLGFDACVAAIGMKANVSESSYPLLCEGTRRQRGDLALLLLVHYKDQPEKIAKIMDKLLDRDIHQLSKSPFLASYYAQQPQRSINAAFRNMSLNQQQQPPSQQQPQAQQQQNERWQDWSSLLAPVGSSRDRFMAAQANRSAAVTTNRSSGTGPGSDSGSSGNSSADSIDSSSSSKNARSYPHEYSPELASGASGGAAASAHVAGASGVATTSGSTQPSSVYTSQGAAALASLPMRPMPHEMSNLVRTSLPSISKGAKFRNKKHYPNVPNQPSDALAHFMFELSKQVLTKAGGNSSTSLFTQPSANQNHRGPHRALHMCAFQIGLYGLGLHNRVSPNWLSRTYSSHVSWINGQANEIGSTAIQFLMSCWEGHLTPPEAASLADKASKSRDNAMVQAAAELALSVLPHAAALNQNEIQRGIQQCKEESDWMLERACKAVEEAARGGGVYPDVMFEVAKHWYDLYNKNALSTPPPPVVPPAVAPPPTSAPPPSHHAEALMAMAAANAGPYPMPYPVFGLIPHGFQGHPAAGAAPLHMYVSPQAAAVQQVVAAAVTNAASMQMQPAVTTAARFNFAAGQQLYHFAAAPPGLLLQPPPQLQAPPPPAAVAVNPAVSAAAFTIQAAMSLQHHPPPTQQEVSQNVSQPPPVQQNVHHDPSKYLISAYRVGMTALESLGRRVSEERPAVKFARNPNNGDDIRWLMTIATKLGLPYLQQFLAGVVNSVMSPFLLQDLAYECGKYLAMTQSFPGLVAANSQCAPAYNAIVQQIRAHPSVAQLVTRCIQTFQICINHKLYHITPADYDEFVSTLMHARRTFHWTPEGPHAYAQLLMNIKRNKNCKRELWQKIEIAKQDPCIQQL